MSDTENPFIHCETCEEILEHVEKLGGSRNSRIKGFMLIRTAELYLEDPTPQPEAAKTMYRLAATYFRDYLATIEDFTADLEQKSR